MAALEHFDVVEWVVIDDQETGIHAMPLHDTVPHEESRWCWCNPYMDVDPESGGVCYIHDALDGRSRAVN